MPFVFGETTLLKETTVTFTSKIFTSQEIKEIHDFELAFSKAMLQALLDVNPKQPASNMRQN